jgi:hypothetical protein
MEGQTVIPWVRRRWDRLVREQERMNDVAEINRQFDDVRAALVRSLEEGEMQGEESISRGG